MWAVFWRILKDRRIIILVYTLAGVAMLWLYISLFPSFKDQSANLEQLLKTYPESLMKAFNIDIKFYVTIGGFLASEQFSFMWPILAIFMTVGYAGSALAGEIEKGTIEILLSEPISRAKLFLSRYLAGAAMLMFFVFFSIFTAIPLIKAYHIDAQLENFVAMFLLGLMFTGAIYAISLFFSSIFSDKGKVFFLSGGLLVLMYVLNILAAIKENLSDLKYFSFFYYFNASKALVYNQIDHWAYLVFLSTILIFSFLGLIIFIRRDIST